MKKSTKSEKLANNGKVSRLNIMASLVVLALGRLRYATTAVSWGSLGYTLSLKTAWTEKWGPLSKPKKKKTFKSLAKMKFYSHQKYAGSTKKTFSRLRLQALSVQDLINCVAKDIRICMCMCICICMCVYMYKYIYMCIYLCMYVCMSWIYRYMPDYQKYNL